MKLIAEFREAGQAVLNYELFARAWDECVELRQQPKDIWVGRSILALQSLKRIEIGIAVDGKIIGGVILAEDSDIHVGKCMSVFAQYVLPEYRNQGVSMKMMRHVLKLVRGTGCRVLAFTHRKSDWRYETIYKEVR